MKYMGSKERIAKHILPIILHGRKADQMYVEPFCGGCNTIDKVTGYRMANDNNKYLIALWKGLQNGIDYHATVGEIDKSIYDDARNVYNGSITDWDSKMNYSDDVIGWIGFMGSANGRFFEGGYSGKSNTKIGTIRDYISESIRNVNRQIARLQGVFFTCGDYREVQLLPNCIVYCDIPYKGTKQYSTSKGFNHAEFWEWCRTTTSQGHKVFISEYEAPEDFKCVWSGDVKSSLSANGVSGGNKISTEKLFTLTL